MIWRLNIYVIASGIQKTLRDLNKNMDHII